MTDKKEVILSNPGKSSAESSLRIIAEKSMRIGFPLLLVILLLAVYSPALVSPGLLDEQYLLAWLKALPKLHGSSGFSGFMSFPGFAPTDDWGVTSKLVLLSLALLFGKSSALLKFISLLLHCACTILTYSCCKRICNIKAPAIISAALFAFYPLHFEATAWLGGIGSELSTLFFLGALLIYLQGRQTLLGWGKIAAIGILMFLAVTSSLPIWTGCLAFGLVELILPNQKKEGNDLTMVLMSTLMPVLIVGICLAATGGISTAALPDLSFKNILSCLRHVFLPVNEINWKHYSKEYLKLYALYPFMGFSFFFGCFLSSNLIRAALYSFALFALLAIPTLGLAAVDSSLYGERWLYQSSAPFCMFLAICIAGLTTLKGKFKIAGIAGTTILTLLLVLFFWRHLWNENAANRNFARVLKSVQKSVRIRQAREPVSRIIVRDLPEKLSVCPLYSTRGPVLIDAQFGFLRSNPLPDGRFKDLLREGKLSESSLRWDDTLKSLMPLDLGPEKASFPEKMSAEAFAGRMEPALGFYKNVHLSTDRSELLLESNSENGPVITIDPGELSTLDGDYLYLEAIIDAPTSFATPRLELHWQTRVHPNYEKRERFSYAHAIVNDGMLHRYLLSLRANGWTTGGIPTIMALGFPAGARVRLRGAGIIRLDKSLVPRLTPLMKDCADVSAVRFTPPYFDYPVDNELGMIALSDKAEAIIADYSVSDIAGANGVSVELSYPDKSFDDANSNHLSGQTYKTFSQQGESGRISVPISELPASGVYSLRVIAKNAKGAYLGQFSDPLCYQVPRDKNLY